MGDRIRAGCGGLILLAGLFACGEDQAGTGPGSGGQGGEAGGHAGAGGEALVVDPCPPDEVPSSAGGACVRPGIPADACGEGFESDGADGCRPLLPAEDCAPGMMAIVGEVSCREIAPCGDGTWGDIPVVAGSEHVDGSYAGADSDGSAAKPWTTIQAAVYAAAPGDLVAVAAGTYVEEVFVHAKAGVTIWGRCPAMVTLQGVANGQQPAALFVSDAAPGTTVRGLAVTGPKKAFYTIALDTELTQVWIHDSGEQGIFAVDSFGPRAELRLIDSLVEQTHRTAVFAAGSDLTVERSVVRDTHSDAQDGGLGRGVYVDRSALPGATEQSSEARLEMRRSVLSRNRAESVRIDGADALIEDTAILDTLGQEVDDDGGVGIDAVWHVETGARPQVTVARTTVSRSRVAGVLVVGADVTLDAVVVEDTLGLPSGRYGRGVEVQGGELPASLSVTRSVIQRNVGAAALVSAAEASFDLTLVRDTVAEPSGPYAGQYGFGLTSQPTADGSLLPTLTVEQSMVSGNQVAGVSTFGGSVLIRSSRITRQSPDVLGFGDGVVVYALGSPAEARLEGSLVHDNARAGIASFGGVTALAGTLVLCNQIDLNGESIPSAAYAFEDDGENVCGCGAARACQVLSSQLEPPSPPE